VQCLAWWGAVRRSTIKILHHWWRIIWREIVLLVYLNTFAEEMSSPAEYHKNFTSLVEHYLERDCATGILEYICRGNE